MEILPIRPPTRRNLGNNCMSRTIRNGPGARELTEKSLLLPSVQPAVCPKNTCAKCKPKTESQNIKCQYVQPARPRNFAPNNVYKQPTERMEDNTIYRRSYIPVDTDRPGPILPVNNLGMPKTKFSTNTIQRMSFPGWYNQERCEKILPCNHDLIGKGAISDATTNRLDYVPKNIDPANPVLPVNNLFVADAPFSTKTVNKLSYLPCDTYQKRDLITQPGTLEWPTGPIAGTTTQKLSYQPVKIPRKEFLPWAQKKKYEIPTEKISDDTCYRKSYIPNDSMVKTQPILPKHNSNLLSDTNNFETNTIYHLSYPGNEGMHRPEAFLPSNNLGLSKQKMDGNTTQKMSFIPTYDHVRAEPILPCNHDLLGKGPISDLTTQRIDYMPKDIDRVSQIRPAPQIFLSTCPLSDRTINRLSFQPPDKQDVAEKFLPQNQLYWPTGKMEHNTTQKMSYLPVPPPEPVAKPWAEKKPYCTPTHRFVDDTSYRLSYDAPGEWINCDIGGGGGGGDSCECQCEPQDCPCTCPCPPVPVC